MQAAAISEHENRVIQDKDGEFKNEKGESGSAVSCRMEQ